MATSLEIQDGDLIDLHVGSPILPRQANISIEHPAESLIDVELPGLNEKIQTSCEKATASFANNCVDVEDILISISDDSGSEREEELPNTSTSDSEILIDDQSPYSPESLEALNVLMKLDKILNETLEHSNGILDGSSETSESETEDKQSVEDCLEDLDNYLKTFDSNAEDCEECLDESPRLFDDGQRSEEPSELKRLPNLHHDGECLPCELGQVNEAFESMEDFPTFSRKHPLRVTVSGEEGERVKFKRVSKNHNSVTNLSAPERISGTDANEEVVRHWIQEHQARSPENYSCETVQPQLAQNEVDTNQVVDTNRHQESSWLRSSMRRIRHLRLPSTEGSSDVSTSNNETNVNNPPQCNVLSIEPTSRPFSAPSRLATLPNGRTESSARRSRGSRSRTVSREPGGRARSGSESSRSRRHRSLSSSESSVASSVDTSPSFTPAPTPVRNNPETIINIRRQCDRSRHTDMPQTESPLGHWPHSMSSMFACLGCTVGLFNISRFAILSIHFGANFIFQFLLLSIIIGLPLFTLQLCLGQQLGSGVIDMWRISPLFQGVGVALLVAQACIGLYSIMGVSWMFVYFRDSFITRMDTYRWAEPYLHYRSGFKLAENATFKLSETVPDYFSGVVLQRHHLNSGNSFGTIKFQLAFNLAVVWMIVFVSLSKGLRSYGKVIYVFTILPIFGTLIVCSKILSLVPTDFVYMVFPETSWSEFFLNSKSWIAASQEVFLTWGLLGAAVMQIASHNKHKNLLYRDSSLISLMTFAILLLAAFLANTCVQILRSNGYNYHPSSFEKVKSYGFMNNPRDPSPPHSGSIPVRYMTHQSFIVGERVFRPGVDITSESGYQALRLATELIPTTFAMMGSEDLSPFWVVLFYFNLILFGIAQQLAIWHCVITGIMAIKANVLKSWETTITFFSCACGFLLGLPMATEFGIYVVYFMDFTVGGLWWLVLIVVMKIVAVFMIRGRPYSGDSLVNALFVSPSRPCLLSWAPALLSFTWNVILPVGLMVCCVAFFKNGNFRELFVWHHAPSLEYWPMWARQIGSMLQLLPVLCVPLIAVIQSYRYLNNGPPDILDDLDMENYYRVQLLYRPPIGEHMEDLPIQENTTTVTNNNNTTTTTVAAEDPPPKYTPPPSYTTATGARIAKFLRHSIRRSIRRITNVLGEGSSRQRPTPPVPQTQLPPPDYSVVLDEMNHPQTSDHLSSVNVIGCRNEVGQSSFGRELSNQTQGASVALSIADVASILRSSFRRSRIRAGNHLRSNTSPVIDNNPASLSAENLVDMAAPIGETSLVLENMSSQEEEMKPTSDNRSSVI